MKFFIMFLFMINLTACATDFGPSSNSGYSYSREQTRQISQVTMGTIESVREVQIEGARSMVGSGTGAIVGGVAGSAIGHGKMSIIGAALGAVAGGLAGNSIEGYVTSKRGVEVTVRIDNGGLVSIVQEYEPFAIGDRVRLIRGRGVDRVSH